MASAKEELTSFAVSQTVSNGSARRPKTTNLCEKRVQSDASKPEIADKEEPNAFLSVHTDLTGLKKRRHSTGSTAFVRYGFGHAFNRIQPTKTDSTKAADHLTKTSKKTVNQSPNESENTVTKDRTEATNLDSAFEVPNQAGAAKADSGLSEQQNSTRSAAFIKYGFGHAFSKFETGPLKPDSNGIRPEVLPIFPPIVPKSKQD